MSLEGIQSLFHNFVLSAILQMVLQSANIALLWTLKGLYSEMEGGSKFTSIGFMICHDKGY
jgi:hypothetical protein